MSKYKSIKKNYFFFSLYIITESPISNNAINAMKDARKIFNELRSNFSREKTKKIRGKLHKKEAVFNFLKGKEQEDSLTNK